MALECWKEARGGGAETPEIQFLGLSAQGTVLGYTLRNPFLSHSCQGEAKSQMMVTPLPSDRSVLQRVKLFVDVVR